MILQRRRYNRIKKGTIMFQQLYYRYIIRKKNAIKIQTFTRMDKHCSQYKKLRSIIISLQYRQRHGLAKKRIATFPVKLAEGLEECYEKQNLDFLYFSFMLILTLCWLWCILHILKRRSSVYSEQLHLQIFAQQYGITS